MFHTFAVAGLATSLVLRTAGVQVNAESARWPFGGSQETAPTDPVQQYASQLEEMNLNLLRSIYDGTCTQAEVSNFNGAVKAFDKNYLAYHMAGGKIYGTLSNAMEAEVLKAWRFKETLDQDYTLKGTNGIFLISDGVDLSPGAGALPVNVAEWYMAKVASLNAFAKHAATTGTQSELNEAYRVCLRMAKSIDYSVSRPQMVREDVVSIHSMKVLKVLQGSVENLQKQLDADGAQAPVQADADALPAVERVSSLEESSIETIGSIFRGEGICVDALSAIAQLKASLLDEPGSNVGGTNSLDSRVLAVQREVDTACHHFQVLNAGEAVRDANELFGDDHLYVIDETVDLVPPMAIQPPAVVEWYMPRVASLYKLATNALAINRSVQAAYHASVRLTMGMELTMDRPMMQKPELAYCLRAMKVMKVLQDSIAEVQKELLSRGAHQYGWDLEPASTALEAFQLFQLGESNYNRFGERMIAQLEDSGVALLAGIFNFRVRQANVDEFAANVSKFKNFMLKSPCFQGHGADAFVARANATQIEVFQVWHQQEIMSNNTNAKGPNGAFAINSTLQFVIGAGTGSDSTIDWYMTKTMSLACIAREALATNEGLAETQEISTKLLTALPVVAKRPLLQEHRALQLMAMLQEVVTDLHNRLSDSLAKYVATHPISAVVAVGKAVRNGTKGLAHDGAAAGAGNITDNATGEKPKAVQPEVAAKIVEKASEEVMEAAARQESEVFTESLVTDDGAS